MNNLTGTFRTLRNIFPNAKLAYSEMLYVGHEESNPEINRCIKSINEQLVDFCNNNEMIFIRHASLQTGGDNLYDDDVHISRAEGYSPIREWCAQGHWSPGRECEPSAGRGERPAFFPKPKGTIPYDQ